MFRTTHPSTWLHLVDYFYMNYSLGESQRELKAFALNPKAIRVAIYPTDDDNRQYSHGRCVVTIKTYKMNNQTTRLPYVAGLFI
jgi:hypothetical protein